MSQSQLPPAGVPNPSTLRVTSLDTVTGSVGFVWGGQCFAVPWGDPSGLPMPRELEIVEAMMRQIAMMAPVEYWTALNEGGMVVDCAPLQKESSWLPAALVAGGLALLFITRKR